MPQDNLCATLVIGYGISLDLQKKFENNALFVPPDFLDKKLAVPSSIRMVIQFGQIEPEQNLAIAFWAEQNRLQQPRIADSPNQLEFLLESFQTLKPNYRYTKE